VTDEQNDRDRQQEPGDRVHGAVVAGQFGYQQHGRGSEDHQAGADAQPGPPAPPAFGGHGLRHLRTPCGCERPALRVAHRPALIAGRVTADSRCRAATPYAPLSGRSSTMRPSPIPLRRHKHLCRPECPPSQENPYSTYKMPIVCPVRQASAGASNAGFIYFLGNSSKF